MKPRTALSGSADNSNLGGEKLGAGESMGKTTSENAPGETQKHADLRPKVGVELREILGLIEKTGHLAKNDSVTRESDRFDQQNWWCRLQNVVIEPAKIVTLPTT